MVHENFKTHEGGCDCGALRYKLLAAPLIVHCCHCKRCQRQTGSAFAINALCKAEKVDILSGAFEEIIAETPSGRGQTITRCPECKTAVWSNYFMGGINKGIRFIRVGSLDTPDRHPPDVHIFTATKQDWVVFPEGAHVEDAFYNYETTWSPMNLKWRTDQLDKLDI